MEYWLSITEIWKCGLNFLCSRNPHYDHFDSLIISCIQYNCCRPDGRVEIEEHGEVTSIEERPSVSGFVVDNQPDLRVSRVLPWLILGRSAVCCPFWEVFTNNYLLLAKMLQPTMPFFKGRGWPTFSTWPPESRSIEGTAALLRNELSFLTFLNSAF